jgi:hypothetical protein
MNDRERFVAIARGEKPDYVPIFGFPGAPGMSRGAMSLTHDRLVATGMPAHVGGRSVDWVLQDVEGWYRYWGTTGPIELDFSFASGAEGIRYERREEAGFVIIEGEDGSLTREVVGNANTYTMPEYRTYPVRDRKSWEFYKARIAPQTFMNSDELEQNCRRFDGRTKPLVICAAGSFGRVRNLLGTEGACIALHEDPELVHDMIQTFTEENRRAVLPLIERLKPESVSVGEDIAFKTSLLLSPDMFREFCMPLYRELAECANAAGVPVKTVDSDGCVMKLAPLLVECGFNSIHPFEVKANNDLSALRQQLPEFVMFGGLEKEVVNDGNEHLIAHEVMSNVPPLLEKGRYFPNGDHGIQPFATFPNLCRFMTLLHETCGNPEGEFPRR